MMGDKIRAEKCVDTAAIYKAGGFMSREDDKKLREGKISGDIVEKLAFEAKAR
jgi:hypothetical protein